MPQFVSGPRYKKEDEGSRKKIVFLWSPLFPNNVQLYIEVDIDKARLEVRLHGCASKIVQTSNRETMRGGEGELTLIIARQNIEIDRVTPPSRLLNKAVAYQTMHRLGKPQ